MIGGAAASRSGAHAPGRSAMTLTRRSMIAAAAAGLASLAWPEARAQADTRLRMFWWGSKERAERTEKANQLFQKNHPGIAIAGETLGWTDYWPRVATQAA